MRTRRQNIQLELALQPAPNTQGTEARTAHAEPERPAAHADWSNRRVRVVWEGRSREAPPYPDCARPLGLRLISGSFRPGHTARMPWFVVRCKRYQVRYKMADLHPPFPLINSHPFGSARSSPGREAAKRTLDGEDRSGIMRREGKGAYASPAYGSQS